MRATYDFVIPSEAPKARSGGIAIVPTKGPLLPAPLRFLDCAAARRRSE